MYANPVADRIRTKHIHMMTHTSPHHHYHSVGDRGPVSPFPRTCDQRFLEIIILVEPILQYIIQYVLIRYGSIPSADLAL